MESFFTIECLNYTSEKHLSSVSNLHLQLIPDSLIVQFGPTFMKEFYYKKLPEAKLIQCTLLTCRQRPMAFLAYTFFPHNFMQKGKERYFGLLCWTLLKCIWERPSRIKTIFQVMRLNTMKATEKDNTDVELLSFGVHPDFLNVKDAISGLRASHLLFESVLCSLKEQNVKTIKMAVKNKNKPTLFFYRSYGATIIQSPHNDTCIVKLNLDLFRANISYKRRNIYEQTTYVHQ